VLLRERERAVDDHDDGDRNREVPHPGEERERRGGPEHEREEVDHLREQASERMRRP